MRVYLSHKIQGKAGASVSDDVMRRNLLDAIVVAEKLRELFPEKLEIYVPAENETFVNFAYKMGFLTVEQILEVDCKIIDCLDAVIVYDPEGDLQGGRLVEYKHACKTNKPVHVFATVESAISWLTQQFLRA